MAEGDELLDVGLVSLSISFAAWWSINGWTTGDGGTNVEMANCEQHHVVGSMVVWLLAAGATILLLFGPIIITIWLFGGLAIRCWRGVGLRAANGGAGGNVQLTHEGTRAATVPAWCATCAMRISVVAQRATKEHRTVQQH